MTLNVKVSGTMTAKTDLRKRISGAWVGATVAYKRVAGAWIAFLQSLVRIDNWTQSNVNPTQSIVEVVWNGGGVGTVLYQVNGVSESSFSWLLSGSAASYEYRTVVTAGSINGGTGGDWLPGTSNSNPGLIANSANGNNKSATFIIEIRQASTGYVLASATFILSARYT